MIGLLLMKLIMLSDVFTLLSALDDTSVADGLEFKVVGFDGLDVFESQQVARFNVLRKHSFIRSLEEGTKTKQYFLSFGVRDCLQVKQTRTRFVSTNGSGGQTSRKHDAFRLTEEQFVDLLVILDTSQLLKFIFNDLGVTRRTSKHFPCFVTFVVRQTPSVKLSASTIGQMNFSLHHSSVGRLS